MNCKKCGNEINENSSFCTNCGERVEREEENTIIRNGNGIVSVSNNKNMGPLFIVVVVLMLLIIVGLVIFIVYKSVRETNVTIEGNKSSNVNEEIKINSQEETTNISDSTTFELNDYIFTIPKGYKMQKSESSYLVMDEEKTVIMEFDGVYNESFNDYLNHIEELKSLLTSKGYTITNNDTKTINKVDYIIFEATSKTGNNLYLSVAKLDNYNIILGALLLSKNTTIDDALVKYSNIILSAEGEEKNSTSTFSKKIPSSSDETGSFVKELK